MPAAQVPQEDFNHVFSDRSPPPEVREIKSNDSKGNRALGSILKSSNRSIASAVKPISSRVSIVTSKSARSAGSAESAESTPQEGHSSGTAYSLKLEGRNTVAKSGPSSSPSTRSNQSGFGNRSSVAKAISNLGRSSWGARVSNMFTSQASQASLEGLVTSSSFVTSPCDNHNGPKQSVKQYSMSQRKVKSKRSMDMRKIQSLSKSRSRLSLYDLHEGEKTIQNYALAILIIADFVLSVYTLDEVEERVSSWTVGSIISLSFVACFTLELLIRIWNLGLQVFLSKDLILDTFLLALTWVALGVKSSLAPVPRMIRIFRVPYLLKTLAPMKKLLLLLHSCVNAAETLAFGLLIWLASLLIFAALARLALLREIQKHVDADDDIAEAFSNLESSITTLVSLMMGDQWRNLAVPIVSIVPWALPFFVLWVFSSLFIFSMILCYLLEAFRTFRDVQRSTDRKSTGKWLKSIFGIIDADNDGCITYHEFWQYCQSAHRSHEVEELLQRIDCDPDVDSEAMDVIWSMLDSNGTGEINENTFVEIMSRLQSTELKWTMHRVVHTLTQMSTRLKSLEDQTNGNFSRVEDMLATPLNSVSMDTFGRSLDKTLSSSSNRSNAKQQNKQCAGNNSGKLEPIMDNMQRRMEPALSGGSLVPPGQCEALQNDSDNEFDGDKGELVDLPPMASAVSKSLSHCASALSRLQLDDEGATKLLKHMRGVPADKVCQFAQQECLDFWASGTVHKSQSSNFFNMSQACFNTDFFISHCWNGPADWYKYFSRVNQFETFEYKKCLELNAVLQAFRYARNVHTDNERKVMEEIILWIDKCCIDQNSDESKELCITNLEGFIKQSDKMIVLLTWNYFSRLWCMYEWACFLLFHHPMNIKIGFNSFLKSDADQTLPLYISSIENLSVEGAQCYRQADIAKLHEKVFHYYRGKTKEESFQSFERFAKVTAICFLVKEIMLSRAHFSQAAEDEWLEPFRALAKRLGYQSLTEVLAACEPAQWYEQSKESFRQVADFWFDYVACQYLLKERKRAFRSQNLQDHNLKSARLRHLGKCDSNMTMSTAAVAGSSRDIDPNLMKSNESQDGSYEGPQYDPKVDVRRESSVPVQSANIMRYNQRQSQPGQNSIKLAKTPEDAPGQMASSTGSLNGEDEATLS